MAPLKKPAPKKTVTTLSDELDTERRRVDFDSYDISVQQLCSMVSSRQIDVAPSYQRRFRWDLARQSELVESVFLGIPVPNLFMAANRDATWEVVDGVQRLSTIVHFCGDESTRRRLGLSTALCLEELKKLALFNGHRYETLPPSIQLQFSTRPVKVVALSDKSDLKVRFDLFERLNTGGVKLSDQEIRGCIYRGRFNDYLEKVAKYDEFEAVVRLRDSMEKDGTREEYALRFFAYLHKYQEFEHSVVDFLTDYMAEAAKSFDYEENDAIFRKTFKELARLFPDGIHRRQRTTPVNLFEAVSVGAALVLRDRDKLKGGDLTWVDSVELRAMTTGATNNRPMVTGRIHLARRHLGGR